MESELIDYLRQRLPPHPCLRLGAGDDAAVLSLGDAADAVVTVDMLMDGVDFRLEEVDPLRVGRKSLAVNLSDLAAMAVEPVAAVVAVALPKRGGMALAKALYEGILPLAAEFDVAIAGGDTNSWDGPLVVSITAIGRTPTSADGSPTYWRRSGARPGDVLVATGEFGGSILGKHLDFTPRVREARLLGEQYDIRAAIDVSDGLAIDLGRMLAESGCGARLDLASVPISRAAEELAHRSADGSSPLDHALGDGEDFELLLAVEANTAAKLIAEQPLGVPLTVIGQFVAEQGLWQRDAAGAISPLAPRGFLHEFD
ncbi:MAG: thiamine-monophosphate kinase [Planctomycetota bacterium]|nr:MAG: thiamine-monophosphate kinase [Planctomycetota bacterium]